MRFRDMILGIVALFILWIVLIYWVGGPMSYTNPINNTVFVWGLILFMIFGLPLIIVPLLQTTKAIKIIAPGVNSTLLTGQPLFKHPAIPDVDPDTKEIIKDDNDETVYTYDEYYVYNLGGRMALNFYLQGGRYSGILVATAPCVEEIGLCVSVRCSDLEVLRDGYEKTFMPQHILDRIKDEYRLKGWKWSDEYIILWGENQLSDSDENLKNISLKARAADLTAELETWKERARNWEQEAQKKKEYEEKSEKPSVFSMGKGEPEAQYNEPERKY